MQDQDFSYYGVRPGDPVYLMARRFQKQMRDIGDDLDRITALERQQTEESLRRCEILELLVQIGRLRLELGEARRAQR